MATVMKKSSDTNSKVPNKTRPALTPEARENQLVSLSVDAAEKALINGTASSQVIVHFLRLGSTKTQLENEKLKRENELLKAKTEALESMKSMESIYKEALEAMRDYSGAGNGGSVEDE